jgi:pyruvate dehydrogenase E1 component
VLEAANLLRDRFGIESDVWSVTSYTELAREAQDCDRWNRLHPTAPPRSSYIGTCLGGTQGPVIAASDYVHAHAARIGPHVERRFVALGTDGFGRSGTREQLRRHFEVNAGHIVLAALQALADDQILPHEQVAAAIAELGIDPEKPNPAYA